MQQSLVRVFEYALGQEMTGKAFFEQSIPRMGIGAAIEAFKRLAHEEESHIRFISKILDDLKSGATVTPAALEDVVLKPTNYFDARAHSEFLKECLEGSMIPDVTVFNTAWLIERDLAEFYARAAAKAQGEARESLAMLSRWEQAHERFFREYREKLDAAYAAMPWGG